MVEVRRKGQSQLPVNSLRVPEFRRLEAAGVSVGPYATYLFTTVQANANGYVSEVGAKALSVWAGAMQTTGGKLVPGSGTNRARFNPGATRPRLWLATFVTPADTMSGKEFYVDLRDNLTSRISVAVDSTKIYVFDGYSATTLAQTGFTPALSTTYNMQIEDNSDNSIVVTVNGTQWILTSSANGLAAVQGGVTTIGTGFTVDDLSAQP